MTADQPQAQLCRRVRFSSAHRYHSPALSEAENQDIFGLCYSKHGHGHNYVLDAHFLGPIDPVTGMSINLVDVDSILKTATDPLDHHHINFDVPEFADTVPTTENIAKYLYEKITELLRPHSPVKLVKVRLFEDDDLWVDYGCMQ